MANPNIVNVSQIYGRTVGYVLSTTATTTIINNITGSNTLIKINNLNVSNFSASVANVTVSWYSVASLGGTPIQIVGNISVPGGSTLNVIDKTSQYYVEENQSIGATASVAGVLAVSCSYEEIG